MRNKNKSRPFWGPENAGGENGSLGGAFLGGSDLIFFLFRSENEVMDMGLPSFPILNELVSYIPVA